MRHGASFDILLKRTGPLRREFETLGKTYCWDVDNGLARYLDEKGLWGRNREIVLNWTGGNPLHRLGLGQALKRRRYDLVFINSLASCALVPWLAQSVNSPIICRVAELQFSLESFCGEECVLEALPYVQHFVAVSDLVTNHLVNRLGVLSHHISKIPGVHESPPHLPSKKELRQRLGLSEEAFVIYGSGSTTWTKGTDLFVQMAAAINRKVGSSARFVWVGGSPNVRSQRELLFDIQKLGLGDVFTFTGPLERPWLVYGAADLFALTSREDSFPQAALEAASLGLPIVCFRGATGSEEFLNEETGAAVEYLHTNAFAKAVLTFMLQRDRYQKASERIKIVAENYSLERIGPVLLKVLNEHL